MSARVSGLSVVLAAMLAAAVTSYADEAGYHPGLGGIGGQIGGSKTLSAEDYSAGAVARFSLAGHWRYAIAPWLRWQVSPGFTWSHYSDQERAPFRDLNFPADSTKGHYLALIAPLTASLQLTTRRGDWLYYAGAGGGAYRVWIENRRKVLEDPVSHKLHRGLYPGVTGQLGVERFLKSLPSTSVEIALEGHAAFAKRDAQFPSGWNSGLTNIGVRIGGNYYFKPNPPKKAEGLPEAAPKPKP
jgi:hypothetical protein